MSKQYEAQALTDFSSFYQIVVFSKIAIVFEKFHQNLRTRHECADNFQKTRVPKNFNFRFRPKANKFGGIWGIL